MTAHVVFTAYDAVAPATTSVTMVQQVIRNSIGFEGLLMSDDVSMGALSGSHRRAHARGDRGRLRYRSPLQRADGGNAGGGGRGAGAGRARRAARDGRRSPPAASRATSTSARPARCLPPCWPTAGRPAHGWPRHDPRRDELRSRSGDRPGGRASRPWWWTSRGSRDRSISCSRWRGSRRSTSPRFRSRRWRTSISPSSRRRASCGSSWPPTTW